jgi:hypothetical protein
VLIISTYCRRKARRARETALRNRSTREAARIYENALRLESLYRIGRTSDSEIESATQRVNRADATIARMNWPNAYDRWRQGLLVPWRFTIAFNRVGLDCASIGRILRVRETSLEGWELGTHYPSWAQLVRTVAFLDTNVGGLTASDEDDRDELLARARSFDPKAIMRATRNR